MARFVQQGRDATRLLRRSGRGEFQENVAFLRGMVQQGGILVAVPGPGVTWARLLLQPDADVILSLHRTALADPDLGAATGVALLGLRERMAQVARPLNDVWMVTHGTGLAVYGTATAAALQTVEGLVVQAAVGIAVPLLGAAASALARRLIVRRLLRTLQAPGA